MPRRPDRRIAPTAPTSTRNVTENRRRQERAYQLKLAGLSNQEIADSPDEERNGAPLYASAGAASNAVKAAMERRTGAATTDQMRMLQFERYERLIRALWARAIGGDMWAHDRIGSHLRDQRDLVIGRAPFRQQIEVISESAIDAEIERLTGELAARGEVVDGEVVRALESGTPPAE